MMGKPGTTAESDELAKLDQEQRRVLDTLAARMRRIVVGDFPELYLRVNEVRAQLEIASKGIKRGDVVVSEQKLTHALRRLNSAKFCLEVALVEVAEVLGPPSPSQPSDSLPPTPE
ncbi:MAG: hypothetical protein NTU91_09200 [Chloroflexi bacterium]|jgi:hypothetical protein|nr:hypothetical protein [Chloroflexota bacterium]